MSINENNTAGCLKGIQENRKNIVVWGCGQRFRRYAPDLVKYCNIVVVSDSNTELHGKFFEEWICVKPEQIPKYAEDVIITVKNPKDVFEIQNALDEIGVKYCLLDEFLGDIYLREERVLLQSEYPDGMPNKPPYEGGIMKKYIGITVPANECNLRCSYCYLAQCEKSRYGLPKINHLPQYIRRQLSNKNIGGEALIGMSGAGETLLCNKLTEICAELLKEGHYLHIVTNGLLIDKIKDIVESAGEYATHIIFKLSFHYEQLRKRGLLEEFVKTVEYIKDSPASFTIEVMPHDELVPYIEEIKQFSMEKFGALPHLTIGRDDSDDQKLLTKMEFEEYKKTWSVFESELFDIKMEFYKQRMNNCMAGKYSVHINLETGDVARCLGQKNCANLYDENFEFDFDVVGDACKFSYCYNCHAYVTLGNMPHILVPSYCEVRDRITTSGDHWIKEPMRKFIGQKLYDNN